MHTQQAKNVACCCCLSSDDNAGEHGGSLPDCVAQASRIKFTAEPNTAYYIFSKLWDCPSMFGGQKQKANYWDRIELTQTPLREARADKHGKDTNPPYHQDSPASNSNRHKLSESYAPHPEGLYSPRSRGESEPPKAARRDSRPHSTGTGTTLGLSQMLTFGSHQNGNSDSNSQVDVAQTQPDEVRQLVKPGLAQILPGFLFGARQQDRRASNSPDLAVAVQKFPVHAPRDHADGRFEVSQGLDGAHVPTAADGQVQAKAYVAKIAPAQQDRKGPSTAAPAKPAAQPGQV